ncbi:MAG: hypothetical protein M1399_07625, partial [Actinobacteria bacterium]|nr:hypothetical protein [Actinomycetota bacterium]
ISVSGCLVGCVGLPVSINLGTGSMTWEVDRLSGSEASKVDSALQAERVGMLGACLLALGACPIAMAPYAGYFGTSLQGIFNTLYGIGNS